MVSKKVQRKTWVEKKRKERRKRNEEEEKGKEEDMRQEDMRKEKEVKASRMAAWVLEEAYCSGQRDGWGCQGSRAWIHAQLGGP